MRRLPGWWDIDPLEVMLTGPDGAIRIGDSIKVVVDGIDPPRGRVDLVGA